MNDVLPTERELQALKVLWDRGSATVRGIYEEMCRQQDLAYTTVLSLVQTMERKGLVGRETEGRGKSHTYTARVQAEPTLRNLAGQFLNRVFDGALGPYLVRAMESKPLSPSDLDELEGMIAEARKEQRGNPK